MADSNHLEILLNEPQKWNDWRKNNPDITPDLSNTKIHHQHFIYKDLSNTNFSGTKLLSVNFFSCKLNNSNFEQANLESNSFVFSSLLKTSFAEAKLAYNTFANAELIDVKGLENCTYMDMNFIDEKTLMKADPLPLEFMRGCGLSNEFIEYITSNRKTTFKFHSCFISHSSNDENFVNKLKSDLEKVGIRCFKAPEDMSGGEKSHKQFETNIDDHDKFVLILSKSSMNSSWVQYEIRKAFKKEKKLEKEILYPISLIEYSSLKEWELFDTKTGGDLAEEIRQYHIPSFTGWQNEDKYQAQLRKVINDLKK